MLEEITMGYLDSLKKVLTPELYAQVETATKENDNFDDDFVPRSRLNKVIQDRNDLRTQLKTATSSGKPDEDEDDKSAGVSTKVAVKMLTQADLDTAIKNVQDKAAADLLAGKKQSAITEILRVSKVRKPELLMPQLDMAKVIMDATGKITGLSEQLDAWKTSDPYLFNDYVPSGTGAGGKEVPVSDRATIEVQQKAAEKAGNTALSVALKRQLTELKG